MLPRVSRIHAEKPFALDSTRNAHAHTTEKRLATENPSGVSVQVAHLSINFPTIFGNSYLFEYSLRVWDLTA
jgi:hypothetical protein